MKKTVKDFKNLIVAVSGKKKMLVPQYFCFIILFLAFFLWRLNMNLWLSMLRMFPSVAITVLNCLIFS